MPRLLSRLIARALVAVAHLTAGLLGGRSSVGGWQSGMGDTLTRYHVAAYLAGSKQRTLSDAARQVLGATLDQQFGYLGRFADQLRAGPVAGTAARAAMYAQGIGASYWHGATEGLPLPAVPKDGTTQCKTRCGCAWEIRQLDGDKNYDCYWRRGKTDSCQTCVQREADWAPLRIRDGRLVR